MNYVIDKRYILKEERSSCGCQIKYSRNGYWYKLDSSYNEGMNEHIASIIARNSTINSFVYYEACTVNGRKACRSKRFYDENEQFITLEEIICTTSCVSRAEDKIR